MTIIYIYREGRRSRLNKDNEYPTEFFYGYHQLRKLGMKIELIEDSDIGMAPPLTFIPRLVNKFSKFFGNIPLGMAAGFILKRHYKKLNHAKCIIATTNGIGIALGIAKGLKLLKPPIILLAMGLLPIEANKYQIYMFKKISNYINLVCISKAEVNFLKMKLSRDDIQYIPFGIDKNFWSVGKQKSSKEYVRSMLNERT